MRIRQAVPIGLLAVLALLLIGCLSPAGQTKTISLPASPTPSPTESTPTAEPSATPPPTLTPSPTATIKPSSTPRPTLTRRPTHTPKPPPTPTRTPLPFPTLEPEGMHAFIAEMMADGGECELPCWWNVTPGETRWSDAARFFTGRGIRVWEQSGRLGLEYTSGGRPGGREYVNEMMWVGFHQEDGIVQSIDVRNEYTYAPLQEDFTALWQRYALQPLLSRHGVPSSVYLNFTVGAPCAGIGNFPDYGMWVAYEDDGFAVRYSGLLLYDHEKWLLCPVLGQVKNIRVRAQSSAVHSDLVDLSTEVYDTSGEFSVYGPLSDMAGMSTSAFYDVFSQPHPRACIEVPKTNTWYKELAVPSDAQRLVPEAEDGLVADLLADNGGCELPCWWGITPGVTPWAEAQQMFLSYGKSVSTYEATPDWGIAHKVGLFGRHERYPFDYLVEHTLYERDGIVSMIGIHGHTPGWPADEWSVSERFIPDWQRHSLDQVLARFGQPSQVLLHYWAESAPPPFSVAVLYEDRGILIEYMGLNQWEEVEGEQALDPILICPQRSHVTDINLWLRSPEQQADMTLADVPGFTDVFSQFGGGYLGLLGFRSTPTLEEATGMSVDEFARIFADPGTDACLRASPAVGDWYP
jgi:hypothetical protein